MNIKTLSNIELGVRGLAILMIVLWIIALPVTSQAVSLADRINRLKWNLGRYPVKACPVCGAGGDTVAELSGSPGGSGGGGSVQGGSGSGITTVPEGHTGISSVQEFMDLLESGSFDVNGKYALTGDIDFSEKYPDRTKWNGGAGFNPIGRSWENAFTGTFDGQGHKITGLYINRPDEGYVGLFGWSKGGTIKNVGLEGVDITGKNYTGGLLGLSYPGATTVANSYTTGNVKGNIAVGGLVGRASGGAIITNSHYTSGTVTGDMAVGSLIGSLTGGSKIINSYSTGSASGAHMIGGLAGVSNGGSLINSYATGIIAGPDRAGGLVGFNQATTVSNCGWYDADPNDNVTSAGVEVTYKVANPNVFYSQSHGVYDQAGDNPWDFTNIWQVNEGGLPTLRE